MKNNYKLSDFTLEEKVKLITGRNTWNTDPLNGKVYEVTVSDGPVGLRKTITEKDKQYDKKSVAYPCGVVLTQTWNPTLAYKEGLCLADDCIENDVDILLAPGVNIKKTPMCGRNFEYLSEDPLVAGLFAKEYIRGVQEKHVGTSLKHFCCNNREIGRIWKNSEVDERTLREIYLKPFEIACASDPTTVMCSYNLVNGVRMSEHKKLYNILRGEYWREDGLIVSDWDACRDRSLSLKAGLDLEMPFNKNSYDNVMNGLKNKVITMEDLDKCVERVLKLATTCSENKKLQKVDTTVEERYDKALEVAEEGIVLLKNNGILPIKNGESISITCRHRYEYYSGGGSSRVQILNDITPLDDCLKANLKNSTIELSTLWDNNTADYVKCVTGVIGKDVSIVVVGYEDSEGEDRASYNLPEYLENLIIDVANKNPNVVVILHTGSAIDVSRWESKVSAILSCAYTGEKGNEAIANILTGKVNPSGKLTETYANKREDYLSENCYRDHLNDVYSDGLQVGYRYFDYHPEKVKYPFGYGLSYSTFQYNNLKATKDSNDLKVSFTIENTSDVDGKEVAQVYVCMVESRVYRPIKELKGFTKVMVEKNSKKNVEVIIPIKSLEYYSTGLDKWTLEKGKYAIYVATNAMDVKLTTIIEL